jgi:hypothetical protein
MTLAVSPLDAFVMSLIALVLCTSQSNTHDHNYHNEMTQHHITSVGRVTHA